MNEVAGASNVRAAFPAHPGKDVIFDNGTTVISLKKSRRKRHDAIVITFDPMMALDISKPAFGEAFLSEAGFDLITVQKRRENWYQDVSDSDIAAITNAHRLNYGRVFTYGSSMGAYAALYFARSLNATALAYSPRDPTYYRYAGDLAFTKRFNMTHRSLREVGDSSTRHLVIFDPLNNIDGPYFKQEVAPVFKAAIFGKLRYTAHPSIYALHEARLIKDMALEFFGNKFPNMRNIALATHTTRTYLTSLAAACDKRHPHWASSIRSKILPSS
ncbi:MAG: hypothetical protein NTAFB05_25500 [Nitrobacter sp.]|uniref:hypothetical protein n=1 Tax=Nitrobacter sp. TaxID=29420 RepID=UPI00387DFDFE